MNKVGVVTGDACAYVESSHFCLCAMKLPEPRGAQHAKLTAACDIPFAINTHNTNGLPQEPLSVSTAFALDNGDAEFATAAWRPYVHLYAPSSPATLQHHLHQPSLQPLALNSIYS